MTRKFKVDKDTEKEIEAGVQMVNWARSGRSKEFMWEQLGKLGFNPEERVKIAKTVNSFMQHKKGNHEDCPDMCEMVETMSQENRGKSIQDIADTIAEKHELHETSTFSKEIQEEWK